MTTKTIEHLQNQIEQLVREHLVGQRAAATAAVERAFAAAAAPVGARAVRRTQGRRRPPTEVAGLAEQLYAAVRANPGELMTVIAAQVGQPAQALNRPMLHLKRSGRVRSAGQRSFTRYFPMTSSKSA
jgi:acyl-CoA reductase-like NAD-dependent aldehyde dehydrogenase